MLFRSDITGKKGEKTISAVSSEDKERPEADLSVLSKKNTGSSVISEGVYVIDENTKVNPVGGSVYYNEFDGRKVSLETIPSFVQDGRIVLKSMKNEFLAFQLIIRGASINSEFKLEKVDIKGPAGEISDVAAYKTWYVPHKGSWYPEVAIPPEQDMEKVIGKKPGIDNQDHQGYYIEILVPEIATEGTYKGSIDFSVDNRNISLPLEINVLAYALSNNTNFVLDLNGYSPAYDYEGITKLEMPDEDALKYEEAYYKASHMHRANYNPLCYSQYGVVYPGYAPEIEGEGANLRVKSWDVWDKRFEKYFTGEAFKDCPRKGVPITNLYLPIHENWPGTMEKYYKIKVESNKYPEMVNEHYSKATLPEVDFAEGYKESLKQIMKEFISHINEKGWQHSSPLFLELYSRLLF